MAPQNPPQHHSWDEAIYDDDMADEVGNLLLLPREINQIADNRAWEIKHFYYSHLGLKEQDRIDALMSEAQGRGIRPSARLLGALQKARHSCAVEPILECGNRGRWDGDIIQERTRQLKRIAWGTLSNWLS